MNLQYDKTFEDIKFLVKYFNKDATTKLIENGLILNVENEEHVGLDAVLEYLYKMYEPEFNDKSLKEAKRLRLSPEVRKIDISISTLLSFFRMYYNILTNGNLKNKSFVDQMAEKINLKLKIDVDFQLLNIRVGKITNIDNAPDLDKLYIEKVMTDKEITVLSGLRDHLPKETLFDNNFLFVTNIKPNKFKGLVSEGMILCAKDEENKIEVISPPNANPGTLLSLDGHYTLVDEFVSSLVDLRKSAYDNALKSFKISENQMTFKGVKVLCNGNYIKTKTANGTVG